MVDFDWIWLYDHRGLMRQIVHVNWIRISFFCLFRRRDIERKKKLVQPTGAAMESAYCTSLFSIYFCLLSLDVTGHFVNKDNGGHFINWDGTAMRLFEQSVRSLIESMWLYLFICCILDAAAGNQLFRNYWWLILLHLSRQELCGCLFGQQLAREGVLYFHSFGCPQESWWRWGLSDQHVLLFPHMYI